MSETGGTAGGDAGFVAGGDQGATAGGTGPRIAQSISAAGEARDSISLSATFEG